MVYSEVHPLGGSASSKTANYNTSIKTLKNILLKKLLNYNPLTFLYRKKLQVAYKNQRSLEKVRKLNTRNDRIL